MFFFLLEQGKERLFLEVARFLHRKVHVTAAKFRLLECLGFSQEDMQLFTLNPQESNIHVVPMWTIASFKRLKHMSNQYAVSMTIISYPILDAITCCLWLLSLEIY